jgi:hypothetical protein
VHLGTPRIHSFLDQLGNSGSVVIIIIIIISSRASTSYSHALFLGLYRESVCALCSFRIDDEDDFKEVMDAMAALDYSATEQDEILTIVAAVLQLGNMQFQATGT